MGNLGAFPNVFFVGTRVFAGTVSIEKLWRSFPSNSLTGLGIFEMVSKGTQSMWQADHVEYRCCDQEQESRGDGQL